VNWLWFGLGWWSATGWFIAAHAAYGWYRDMAEEETP
jgi:hypothetical protein